LLDKGDVQDLRDAIRELTTFLRDSDRRHQYALNRLAEADIGVQIVQALHEIRGGITALRTDLYDLTKAMAAAMGRIGNGHDRDGVDDGIA
jgi:hypothetical protein